MAVYKRSYKSYSGPLTSEWFRFLVIPRYAWEAVFSQRIITILYVVCFFYPLGAALTIYFNHNTAYLAQYMPVPRGGLLKIENMFFYVFTTVQCTLAFLLTAFVGPGLVSPDLVNNALPLYFCRPLSRTGYVAGKIMVLFGLLSAITWIPGLLLFALQASLADSTWWTNNAYLGGAIFFSCVLWILLISVMALALSAWVRWKIIAGALMLVILFLGAGLSEMIRQVARTDSGGWLDMANNAGRIWLSLFRIRTEHPFTLGESILDVLLFTALWIFLLTRKVKAYEVVRG
jgi:ABC-2 type transport system permease protein